MAPVGADLVADLEEAAAGAQDGEGDRPRTELAKECVDTFSRLAIANLAHFASSLTTLPLREVASVRHKSGHQDPMRLLNNSLPKPTTILGKELSKYRLEQTISVLLCAYGTVLLQF